MQTVIKRGVLLGSWSAKMEMAGYEGGSKFLDGRAASRRLEKPGYTTTFLGK
jgi:hypothetical protein